ncbi:MAG: hypothetical protein LBE92_21130 [Chryseobacterium sp.]|jgi:hypothetical protein|uniref:hypothetical protein n=1 Tax=Chryseobacterium sp. TaxID=1871047 RepID=UPI00281866D5|nr:hypothetical protein [Chryseobacterium sp.]MDR2238641.1 hypothetical protein [Chryseobacterium sp.]
MKSEENKITPNRIKGFLYIIFLITTGVYFIFFHRSLKLERKEKCPCDDSYTLYQYRDRGTVWNRDKFDHTDYKTYKLENKLGFTVDKQVHINPENWNDTLHSVPQKSEFQIFTPQFSWNCKNKSVRVSKNHTLSFK